MYSSLQCKQGVTKYVALNQGMLKGLKRWKQSYLFKLNIDIAALLTQRTKICFCSLKSNCMHSQIVETVNFFNIVHSLLNVVCIDAVKLVII